MDILLVQKDRLEKSQNTWDPVEQRFKFMLTRRHRKKVRPMVRALSDIRDRLAAPALRDSKIQITMPEFTLRGEMRGAPSSYGIGVSARHQITDAHQVVIPNRHY